MPVLPVAVSRAIREKWHRGRREPGAHGSQAPRAPIARRRFSLAADSRISVLATRHKLHFVLINKALKRVREDWQALQHE